jgi:hypothetical protein
VLTNKPALKVLGVLWTIAVSQREASPNPAKAKATFNKLGSADWQLVTTLTLPSPPCPPTYFIAANSEQ